MTVSISLTVNGRIVRTDVEPRTLLIQLLRETLGLTGAHVGCDTSQCGAYVIHVNDVSVKACTMLAVWAHETKVTTIEGISAKGSLHPLQEAFRKHHALQCGFCTPGMIMSALDLIARNPDPGEEDIRRGLEGNICRCTGYLNIIEAIREGARAMRQGRR